MDESTQDVDYDKADDPTQVLYCESNEKLSPKILMIGAHSGSLWAYKTDKDGDLELDLYDTSATPKDGRNLAGGMDAYVWSKDGLIFAAPHAPGQLHHSSFTSGNKVKCAGFIGVKQGKVVSANNDSGHYLPPPAYLRDFVSFLHKQDVLDPKAEFELKLQTGPLRGLSYQELLNWKPVKPEKPLDRRIAGTAVIGGHVMTLRPPTPLKPPLPANLPWKKN